MKQAIINNEYGSHTIELTDKNLIKYAQEATGAQGWTDDEELDGWIEFGNFDDETGEYDQEPKILDRAAVISFLEETENFGFELI